MPGGRFQIVTLALAALTACSREPMAMSGRLVDARTGAGVAHVEVRLADLSERCVAITIQTDAEGRFSATDPCASGIRHAEPADPGWYLPEGALAGTDVELRAWRAPPDAGVYTVSGTTVTPLVTHTVLDTVRIFDTSEEVRFPVEIPGAVPRIAGDTALLLVGGVLPDLAFEPLVPSPERRWFGTKAEPQPVDPWVYLGVRFTSDTVYERVPATLDAAKLTSVGGRRPLRYVPGDALPPGRYALPTADGTRAFLLDFGVPTPE